MATIVIHPAVAADYQAAQALAARHGMQVTLEGRRALLEPLPGTAPANPWTIPAHFLPTGGDAA